MKTFCLMLSFFTRLPVPRIEYTEDRYVKGLPLLPLVGLVMGLFLYALSFFGLILHPPVTAMILLGGYIYLTGGLHLDGLADTCDGIFSGRERERMLEIMKDSRIGSFGVLSMLFFFVFYMVMFQYLPYDALILLPIVGKSAPLISASMAEYIRPGGMGKLLVDNTGKKELAAALTAPYLAAAALPFVLAALGLPFGPGGKTALEVSLGPARGVYFQSCVGGGGEWGSGFLGLDGQAGLAGMTALIYILSVTAGLASVALLTKMLKRTLGGITGDTMGMVCELSQMAFVFAVYAIHMAAMLWG